MLIKELPTLLNDAEFTLLVLKRDKPIEESRAIHELEAILENDATTYNISRLIEIVNEHKYKV